LAKAACVKETSAMEQPEIRYARSGEVNIAYEVTGDGPFDLVLVSGFVTHLELDWKEPRHARFLGRLGSFARLIRFDKRGTGLSDRPSALGGIETRMDDVRAVLDAVGCERAALFAFWEGGPMAAVFAATYPQRTSALVLFGTFTRRTRSADYPWHVTRNELVAAAEHLVEVWGTQETTALESFSPGADAALRRWWIARDRAGATPGAIRQLIMSNLDVDVRPALHSIQAPTLVLHPEARADEGAYIAARIPGARFGTTPDDQCLPWLVPEAIDEVEQFLTGVRPTPLADRVLATILVTDLVDSTDRARELGDRAWSELLEQHHAEVRHELERFRGEEIDTAGDGFLALFDGPARAIRCALDVRNSLRELGLDMRAGVHTGEVERLRGEKPRGIAVHIGARVAGHAAPGEVLVTATTRDLVAGSGLEFEARGEHQLKGIPEAWRLFNVTQ
jgi:class 3 adenylate cyclase/pimeloyl-ACP methyl ester carboxylesterase